MPETIVLSELLDPEPSALWTLVRQAGVRDVVTILDGAEQQTRWLGQDPEVALRRRERLIGDPWSTANLEALVERYAAHGFRVAAIEDTPPLDRVRLGMSGRDETIEQVINQIRSMGTCGIPILCYNWMAVTSWARTATAVPLRGGALSTGYEDEQSRAMPPLVAPGQLDAEQLWDALAYFLRAVVPTAEESGVRLALHPDDPPIGEVRGIPRIIGSVAAYRRVLDLYPSHSNAITLCQGNFALMSADDGTTIDVVSAIEELGARDAIAFVHFRDVRGNGESFVETFHDEGQTDLPACMRAYRQVGFHGPMRPDHVPTMHGESNERPGYGALGRLFALGYIRGLEQATFGPSS